MCGCFFPDGMFCTGTEAKADVEELRKVMERLKERVEEVGKSRDPCEEDATTI